MERGAARASARSSTEAIRTRAEEVQTPVSQDVGEHIVIDLRVPDRPQPEFEPVEGRGLLGAKRWQLAAKRIIDLVLSVVFLALLSPVIMASAAAVKLTSRGPIFYLQERVGLKGEHFRLVKFRSMIDGAHSNKADVNDLNDVDGPVFKIRRDPRLTRVGRVLRRFSIDELPNLVNVLSGKMSLVGPRPPLPEEVSSYGDRDSQRLRVKPGVTCIWQVSGRNELSFDRWMEMDLEYIRWWSIRRDLLLLAQTPAAVITGRGAY